MTSVYNVLNRTTASAGFGSTIDKAKKSIVESGKKIEGETGFLNRAEAQEANVIRSIDARRAEFVENRQHISNNTLMTGSIARQEVIFVELKNAIEAFEVKTLGRQSQGSNYPQTVAQIADEAFDNLTRILGAREDGRYVFGGRNSNQHPLAQENGSILDLKGAFTNIAGGFATSNYTTTSASGATVEITNGKSVRTDVLSADMPLIRDYIAQIKQYKADNNDSLTAQYNNFRVARELSFGQTQIEILQIKDDTVSATTLNENRQAAILEELKTTDDFLLPQEVLARQNAINSLLVSFQLAGSEASRLQTVSNILTNAIG